MSNDPLKLDDFSEVERIGDTQSGLNKYLDAAEGLVRNIRGDGTKEFYLGLYAKLEEMGRDIGYVRQDELEEIIDIRHRQFRYGDTMEIFAYAVPINLSPYETIHVQSSSNFGAFLPSDKQIIIHEDSTIKEGDYNVGHVYASFCEGVVVHDQPIAWAMLGAKNSIIVSQAYIGTVSDVENNVVAYGDPRTTDRKGTVTTFVTDEQEDPMDRLKKYGARRYEGKVYAPRRLDGKRRTGKVFEVLETEYLFNNRIWENDEWKDYAKHYPKTHPRLTEQVGRVNEAVAKVETEGKRLLQIRGDSPAKVRSLSDTAVKEFNTLLEMVNDG